MQLLILYELFILRPARTRCDFRSGLHATQTRKGTDTPDLSHLLGVAGYVLEYGGSEDQVITAMPRDATED